MKLNVDLSALFSEAERMGANPIADFHISLSQQALDPIDDQLGSGGIEIGPGDIETVEGLIGYKGRQVLLYIRDHSGRVLQALEDGSKGNKYHVSDCSTLKDMRAKGRYERYVVTNELTGVFHISGSDWGSGQAHEGETALKVCRNCLRNLNFKGYQNKPKGPIFEAFSLEEFFSTYSSFFPHMPKGLADKKSHGYTDDWATIAGRFKADKGFICQSCNVHLEDNKSLLHVHHLNGVKNDNREVNLKPLCLDCHRKQPLHGHMGVSHKDMALINRLRREQGLIQSGNWNEVKELADPGLLGTIDMCEKYRLRPPEVGMELVDDMNVIQAQLELAWPASKVAIVIGGNDAEFARAHGWQVWTMIDSLERFSQFSQYIR